VVHEANTTGGFGAEIVARIASDCFFDLDQPPRRIALPDVRVPAAPTLQAGLVPTAATISASSLELLSA
jgi:pyruvate/2-oxoglutarate/acetoin dehydrogenase E1 component